MYDVYVELLNPDQLVPPELASYVTFKMAYVNSGYTDMQIAVRLCFLIFSLAATIWYLWTVCRQPPHVKMTDDQRSLVWISIAGVCFNDPTYLISIFKPSLFSSVVSQIWPAWFFALLLRFWLRSLERTKEQEEEQEMLKRNANNAVAQGVRKASPLEKAKNVFFTVLVVDLVALYAVYQLNVSEDPSYIQTATSVKPTSYSKALMGLVIFTGLLLAAYLAFFLFTFVRNVVFICQLTPRARGLFLFSTAMLFMTLGTVAFGVFSPVYSNGHAAVFFQALFNAYVWALIYLNWPMGFGTLFDAPGLHQDTGVFKG